MHRIIYDIADYVKLIENECYSLDPKTPKATGWQNFSDCKQKERMCQDFRTRIVDRYIGPKGIMASVNKWLWLIFIILTIVIALVICYEKDLITNALGWPSRPGTELFVYKSVLI